MTAARARASPVTPRGRHTTGSGKMTNSRPHPHPAAKTPCCRNLTGTLTLSQGSGKWVGKNGETYKGEWIDDKKTGNGEWKSSVFHYVGTWEEDLLHGEASLGPGHASIRMRCAAQLTRSMPQTGPESEGPMGYFLRGVVPGWLQEEQAPRSGQMEGLQRRHLRGPVAQRLPSWRGRERHPRGGELQRLVEEGHSPWQGPLDF